VLAPMCVLCAIQCCVEGSRVTEARLLCVDMRAADIFLG
jgi:pentatricopeptide repeat protein